MATMPRISHTFSLPRLRPLTQVCRCCFKLCHFPPLLELWQRRLSSEWASTAEAMAVDLDLQLAVHGRPCAALAARLLPTPPSRPTAQKPAGRAASDVPGVSAPPVLPTLPIPVLLGLS